MFRGYIFKDRTPIDEEINNKLSGLQYTTFHTNSLRDLQVEFQTTTHFDLNDSKFLSISTDLRVCRASWTLYLFSAVGRFWNWVRQGC